MSNLRDKELVHILNGARDDILRQMQDQALNKAGSDYKLYEKLLAWRDQAVKEARIDEWDFIWDFMQAANDTAHDCLKEMADDRIKELSDE